MSATHILSVRLTLHEDKRVSAFVEELGKLHLLALLVCICRDGKVGCASHTSNSESCCYLALAVASEGFPASAADVGPRRVRAVQRLWEGQVCDGCVTSSGRAYVESKMTDKDREEDRDRE